MFGEKWTYSSSFLDFSQILYDNQVKLLMAPAFFIYTSNKQVTAKESSEFSINNILFLIHSYNLNNL